MLTRGQWLMAGVLAAAAAGTLILLNRTLFPSVDSQREKGAMKRAIEMGNRSEVERIAANWRARGHGDEATIALANLALFEGNPAEALGILTPRKFDGEARSEAAVVAGDALLVLKRVGEAFQAYQSALTVSPDNSRARLGLAACFLELGSLEQAAAQAREASTQDDSDGRPWHIEASVRHQLREWNEAAEAAEKALARKLPRSSRIELLALLAQWNLENGKVEDARRQIESRALLAPDGARQQALEGWLAEATGNTAKGLSLVREALNSAPSDPEIAQWLAEALTRAGDWGGALEAATKSRELSPDRPSNYHLRAMALDRLGKPVEAREERERQERVTRLLATMTELAAKANADPSDAGIREEMARVSEQLGRPDWARAWRETSRASSLLRSGNP